MHQSEDDEDDSEDVEAEEDSDEKCEEYDEDDISRADLGVQTSFTTPDSESRYRKTGSLDSENRYRGMGTPDSETRFRGRNQQESENRFRGKSVSSSGLPSPSPTYSLQSQQLRKNLDQFGSLNEALRTLPTNKSNSNHTPVTRSQPSPPSSNPLTQVSRPPRLQFNRRENTGNSMLISSLIIFSAILFFAFLCYQYMNLSSTQPQQNIPLCVGIEDENSKGCIPGNQLLGTLELLKKVLKILKDDSSTPNHPFLELKEQLRGDQGKPEYENYWNNIIILIKENPSWGIQPVYQEDKITHLAVSFGIFLWVKYFIYAILGLLFQATNYILILISAVLTLWLMFNGWKTYKARQEKKRQDMFIMVDKVLSMLRDNHLNREGHGPSYLAIDHIRDQLIPPQERENMSETWKNALQYLNKHESRVREEIQHIQGEEFRVWQWLPDISTSPSPIKPGQRAFGPYSPGLAGSPSTTGAQSRDGREILNKSNPWPYVPTTSPRSPEWQGSAFNLNRNVSAPTDPPTSCLKIRYMFDPLNLEHNWISDLHTDILTKCSGARILHIAVDRESREGVVYIKTMSSDDAGIVFNCLHGQWYKKQLVTVKYLRRDRYHQRFPDSAKAETPLTVK